MYAIILIDGEYADSYATLNIFEDKALWDWLNAPVEFGDDTSVGVPLPDGYTITTTGDQTRTHATITVGSPDNDKAHAIHALLGSTVEVDVDEDALDEDDFDEDFDTAWRAEAIRVCAERGVTDTYEGLWY